MTASTNPATVHAYRGPMLENVHHVSVAVVNPHGHLLASCGTPHMTMVLRSTAKPFQAQAMFATGAMDAHLVSSEELALACASHDTMPQHVDRVRTWLDRLDLTEDDLGCGPHLPGHEPSRRALIRTLEDGPTPIHNNCSGKHTGMLTACSAAGWPTSGYLDVDHPLQQEIRRTVEALSGESAVVGGTDGCSAPTFGVSVKGLATAYARLAAPEAAPRPYRKGLSAAFEAMRNHPELIAGPTTLDTLLIEAYPDLVCKRGAAGGYGMGLSQSPRGPLGVGVWVHDGSSEARSCAVLQVLDFLGCTPTNTAPLDRFDGLVRRNCRNVAVGSYKAHLGLRWTE